MITQYIKNAYGLIADLFRNIGIRDIRIGCILSIPGFGWTTSQPAIIRINEMVTNGGGNHTPGLASSCDSSTTTTETAIAGVMNHRILTTSGTIKVQVCSLSGKIYGTYFVDSDKPLIPQIKALMPELLPWQNQFQISMRYLLQNTDTLSRLEVPSGELIVAIISNPAKYFREIPVIDKLLNQDGPLESVQEIKISLAEEKETLDQKGIQTTRVWLELENFLRIFNPDPLQKETLEERLSVWSAYLAQNNREVFEYLLKLLGLITNSELGCNSLIRILMGSLYLYEPGQCNKEVLNIFDRAFNLFKKSEVQISGYSIWHLLDVELINTLISDPLKCEICGHYLTLVEQNSAITSSYLKNNICIGFRRIRMTTGLDNFLNQVLKILISKNCNSVSIKKDWRDPTGVTDWIGHLSRLSDLQQTEFLHRIQTRDTIEIGDPLDVLID